MTYDWLAGLVLLAAVALTTRFGEPYSCSKCLPCSACVG